MKVSFRPVDYQSYYDLELLVKWSNDPQIRHLATWHPDAESLERLETLHDIQDKISKAKVNPDRQHVMILLDGEAVGEMSLSLDAPMLTIKEPRTAWIGITIGESHARGKGVGAQAMTYLETLAANMGAKRIELGVFEFNSQALALYEKLGYKEICRVPEFTYWNDRMWADIRMFKELNGLPG